MELPLSRSTTVTDEEPMCSFEEESEGLTTKQKLAVGFIWLVAGIYSVMSNSILSKGHTVKHQTNKLICNKTQLKQCKIFQWPNLVCQFVQHRKMRWSRLKC